jgi:hypothetical protein
MDYTGAVGIKEHDLLAGLQAGGFRVHDGNISGFIVTCDFLKLPGFQTQADLVKQACIHVFRGKFIAFRLSQADFIAE